MAVPCAVTMTIESLCRVCQKKYDGAQHCGAEVCRACAAFYKRTATQKKVFVCRSGTNNCEVDSSSRKDRCQKCRFTKCLLAGLTLFEKAEECEKNPQCSVFLHTDTHKLAHPTAMPMLRKFTYYYNKATLDVIQYENRLKNSCSEGYSTKCGITRITSLRHTLMPEIYRVNEVCMRNVLKNVFPAFYDLTDRQQDDIFFQTMFAIWDLESAYRTLRIFSDPNCKKLMWTETMFVDTDNITAHLGLSETQNDAFSAIEPMDRILLNEYLAQMIDTYLTTTHAHLHRARITDVEFIAAIALLLWDARIFENLGDAAAEKVAEDQRRIIYNELFYYYREIMRVDDYVERVMNLKELGVHIQTNLVNLRKHANFLKLFNYFTGGQNDLYDAMNRLPYTE